MPRKAPPPTETDLATVAAIREMTDSYGRPPSYRELAGRFGVSSTNAVKERLDRLERKGLIRRAAGASRAIRILVAPERRSTPGQRVAELSLGYEAPRATGLPSALIAEIRVCPADTQGRADLEAAAGAAALAASLAPPALCLMGRSMALASFRIEIVDGPQHGSVSPRLFLEAGLAAAEPALIARGYQVERVP